MTDADLLVRLSDRTTDRETSEAMKRAISRATALEEYEKEIERRGAVKALRWAAGIPSDGPKVMRAAAGRIEDGGWLPWEADE